MDMINTKDVQKSGEGVNSGYRIDRKTASEGIIQRFEKQILKKLEKHSLPQDDIKLIIANYRYLSALPYDENHKLISSIVETLHKK